MMIPEELLYTDQHEWVRLEGDTTTGGITDYAQKALGDITFVELPAVDSDLKKGDEATALESCKAAASVYAPAAGRIVAVNTALEDNPGLINSDPYGRGWIFKMSLADKRELIGLMNAQQYAQHLGDQE